MSERRDGDRGRLRRRAAGVGGAVAVVVAVGLLVAFLMRPPPVDVMAAATGTVRETVEGPGTIRRALANEPPLILADEPTASLDTERGMKVMELLRKVGTERGSAIIVVTHDERMVAGFDSILRLRDGHVDTLVS